MVKKMNERKSDGKEKAGESKKCLVDIGAFSSHMKPLSFHLQTIHGFEIFVSIQNLLPRLNLSSHHQSD